MSAAANPNRLARSVLLCAVVLVLSSEAFSKRLDPPDLAPVVYNGLEYTAPAFPSLRERSHKILFDGSIGGIIEVCDATTHKLKKRILVYKNYRFPLLEGDVQDIFISSMVLDSANKQLILEDEHGGTYHLDLQSHRLAGIRGWITAYGWLLSLLVISTASILGAPKLRAGFAAREEAHDRGAQ